MVRADRLANNPSSVAGVVRVLRFSHQGLAHDGPANFLRVNLMRFLTTLMPRCALSPTGRIAGKIHPRISVLAFRVFQPRQLHQRQHGGHVLRLDKVVEVGRPEFGDGEERLLGAAVGVLTGTRDRRRGLVQDRLAKGFALRRNQPPPVQVLGVRLLGALEVSGRPEVSASAVGRDGVSQRAAVGGLRVVAVRISHGHVRLLQVNHRLPRPLARSQSSEAASSRAIWRSPRDSRQCAASGRSGGRD